MTDTLGFRKIFGVIVPSPNTAAEPEYAAMRPRGVTNQTARIMTPIIPLVDDASFSTHVNNMRSGIENAVDQIITGAPDHLVMGLSLETFWEGVEGSKKLQQRLRECAGMPVTMGSDAILAALETYGNIKRIAILTPHPPLGDRRVRQFFTEAGYDVAKLKGLNFTNGLLLARASEQELRGHLESLDGDGIDAIVQVGTNLPMARVAGEAERWLGKPVIAINTAIYWHALRKENIADPIDGFGSLLSKH